MDWALRGRLCAHGLSMSTIRDFFENKYRPRRLRGRSRNTLRLYRHSITAFSRWLGHEAELSDLNDDAVCQYLQALREQELSPYTVAKERSQLLAIWNCAARLKIVDRFPDVMPEKKPERIPLAWTIDEMTVLLGTCRQLSGMIGNVPAKLWWAALHLTIWDTAERIGALIACRREDLQPDGWLLVRAEYRKGNRSDKVYKLHDETMAALLGMRGHQALFPWPYSTTYLWTRYKAVLERAGLPTDRRSKFHRMRKSTASHYAAAGGNAQILLDHQDSRTTRRYLDPRIVSTASPAEMLPRITTLPPQTEGNAAEDLS